MKNKKRILLVMIIMNILLTGCWNRTEPERMLYVHGLGIDYKDGEFHVYTQIIDFASTAKMNQPTRSRAQSEVGLGTGKTVDEAIFKLYNSVDRRVYWGHLSYIVFSEEAMTAGAVNPVVDTFIRYRDTRYEVQLYGTSDPVKDILLTTPIINTAITLSKLGDPRNSFEQNSFIHPITMRTLIIGLDEPSHEMTLPYVIVKENWETVDQTSKVADLAGVGILSPKEFKGFIAHDKARGIQWMTDKSKRIEVSVKSGEEETNRQSLIVDSLKRKVTPTVNGSTVSFKIDVSFDIAVSSVQGKTTYGKLVKAVEKQVEKEIRETYEEGLKLDADVYRLSEYLYRKDVKSWKRLQKEGKVELDEESIDSIHVHVRRVKSGRKSLTEVYGP
ncbi:Ger(x)C family spore germination protein [Sporosarcina cyprini]|uniref:Ger(x)C family spore germination protein n=1 Tax=Sporosarcina cyprini TaxID=2910523 RepID=UPI001EDF5053|nr:Ger(x)C family spore germination protein [Sporosarcina cyprini]MCG3087194.1 Ger(x)C family spore germination protein [Sporosarcina cyprini]